MSLTKREIAIEVARTTGITQPEAMAAVQATLDCIAEEMANGGNVELRNFGVFEIKTTKSRVGRNPNKPQNEVIIPERTIVKFRAGKELKARVEKLGANK